MAAYLAEHIPHLQSLHAQLDLPSSALQSDETRIEAAIKDAVEALVREREREVQTWKDKIQQADWDVRILARAVGNKEAEMKRRESIERDALPKQHEKLVQQQEGLEKDYNERLAKAKELSGMIDSLSTILGPPFEPAAPLNPMTLPAEATRIPQDKWLDVGDAILNELQIAAQRALDERVQRVVQLEEMFRDLFFLHAELALPPFPAARPHDFPATLLPSSSTEERPGTHAEYEATMSRFISSNSQEDLDAAEEDEGAMHMKALEAVEPEIGLMGWANEVASLWSQEKENREARIQTIFDKLEPLWLRLEVDEASMELFMDMNRGCGEATIEAYEAELDRCLELRRSSLSAFVVAARREIEMLWQELMYSEGEMGAFGPFIDDDYTEELLLAHEEEAVRLREEVESKASILPKVREWHKLILEEVELEKSATDPNRFSRRGAAMLREEKLRKRVEVMKPKIENELLSLLPVWEQEHGRALLVDGERVVDKIEDARMAKEMVKEAKKRAKAGLAPAKTVRATPAVSTVRSKAAPATARKREAPTPTPAGAYQSTAKKQRLAPMSSIRPPQPAMAAHPSALPRPIARNPGSSPTPDCRLPRTANLVGRSVSATSTTSTVFSAETDATIRVVSMPELKMGLAGGKKRRESFKPRQSIAGGLLAARTAGFAVYDMVEEEAEGEEDMF